MDKTLLSFTEELIFFNNQIYIVGIHRILLKHFIV